jgi:hypothetical protein
VSGSILPQASEKVPQFFLEKRHPCITLVLIMYVCISRIIACMCFCLMIQGYGSGADGYGGKPKPTVAKPVAKPEAAGEEAEEGGDRRVLLAVGDNGLETVELLDRELLVLPKKNGGGYLLAVRPS